MTITAKAIRYIKLGKKTGGWEDSSLNNGEIHFGYGGVSHEMALAGDVGKIKQQEIGKGKQPQVAASTAQQVHDFYHLGADCLWITFARDHLWWTFADPEVVYYGPPTHDRGERMRKSIGGWRNTDINGKSLRIDSLSTKLTKVQFYQRTICGVEADDYLLRRINGVEEPLIAQSNQARDALLDVLTQAITSLHWKDFETLTDVVFARSGWHRASAIGGNQKLVDVVLEQPTTAELAAVQVKSSTSQGGLGQLYRGSRCHRQFRSAVFRVPYPQRNSGSARRPKRCPLMGGPGFRKDSPSVGPERLGHGKDCVTACQRPMNKGQALGRDGMP